MEILERKEKENLTTEKTETCEKDAKLNAEKSRQCPVCHIYYKCGNSYWQHVRYVHANFLCQCVICDKCYKRTTMAKHHVLHSHKIAWHLCGNYVRKIRKTELQQQQQNSKNAVDEAKIEEPKIIRKKILHLIRSFNCYHCNESFSNIKELFKHVNVHVGEQDVSDVDEAEESNYGSNEL